MFNEKEEVFDFGFSFKSEEEIKKIETEALEKKSNELTETQRKLIGLREMYGRLLERLKQEPENQYIYWPNRVQAVNDFQEKVNNYIKENK